MNVPDFDPSLKNLNEKLVTIQGFVIPSGVNTNSFVLSKTPFASCYFCGNGGVETAMAVKYKGKMPRYKTDDFITLQGRFKLNGTDVNELILYIGKCLTGKKMICLKYYIA